MSFKHLSLFSGQGGNDLAAEWMGWENIAHCEKNEFCLRILKYYWPNAKTHTDIKTTDFTVYKGRIDILTGGFPCQAFSTAGKQRGTEDERYLWPEMFRAIREVKPPFVLAENVPGLISWGNGVVFDQVQADLESEGFEVIPFVLPAAGIEAPHGRHRIWFIAYSHSNDARRHRYGETRSAPRHLQIVKEERQTGRKKRNAPDFAAKSGFSSRRCDEVNGNPHSIGLEGFKEVPPRQNPIVRTDWSEFPTVPPVLSGNDGLSARLDAITFSSWRNQSIMASGNSVVPQLVLEIFKAIEAFYKLKS